MLLKMKKLVTVALLLSLGACGEQMEETYATWAEADRAGAVERGWVPAFVPTTAHDIMEIHDIDTNQQRLEFTIPLGDFRRMVAGLRGVSAQDQTAAAELYRELDFKGATEVYVVCSDVLNGALIVDRETGRAIYKTPVEWANDDCS